MLGARHLSSRSRNTLPEDRIEYNGADVIVLLSVFWKKTKGEREREEEWSEARGAFGHRRERARVGERKERDTESE